MLPQGMTLEDASAGFRNQGQFIAAVNVSKNRGIPFVDLKQAMTVDGLSVGQAVKQLQTTPATTTPGGSGTGTTGGTTTTGTTTGGTTTGTTTGGTTTGTSSATATTTSRASR
jgi:hypothetical protein